MKFSELAGKRILIVASYPEGDALSDYCQDGHSMLPETKIAIPVPLFPYCNTFAIDCAILHNVQLLHQEEIIKTANSGRKIIITLTVGNTDWLQETYECFTEAGIKLVSRYIKNETLLKTLAKMFRE